jgi:hypothetical protein
MAGGLMLTKERIMTACIYPQLSFTILYANPYKAVFSSEGYWNPSVIPLPNMTAGIRVGVSFGPFMQHCDYAIYCQPPLEIFDVIVERKSPCIPGEWVREYYGRVVGDRLWRQDGPGQFGCEFTDPPWCCHYVGLRPGFNKYLFIIGPLISGEYRVRLNAMHYPLWDPDTTLCSWDKSNYMWRGADTIQTAQYNGLVIHNTQQDLIAFSNLFYIDDETGDTLYNWSLLDLLKYYSVVCKVRSTRRDVEMQPHLWGWLEPEDVLMPEQVIFNRWPLGDDPLPCPPDINGWRDYTYKSVSSFRPLDLWDLSPEEWATLKKKLTCTLKANENFGPTLSDDYQYDISIPAYTISTLHIEPLIEPPDDGIYSFRPANKEKIYYQFYYSNSIGLNPGSDVTLNIIDKYHHLTSVTPIAIPDYEDNFPFIPHMFGTLISWDGRNNQEGQNPGHLADPNADSYHCYVYVNEGQGMMSNAETFDVIPKLDSVLITHHSWFPPTLEGHCDTLFAVARAKWDDSGNPLVDNRYYIPEGEYYPEIFTFWDNKTFVYFDLLLPPAGPRQYYEVLGNFILPSRGWWNSEHWGTLSYYWFVDHDYAFRENNSDNGWQNIVFYEVDTTRYWGSVWNPVIYNGVDWWNEPKDDDAPMRQMRLLTSCEIINTKDSRYLQDYKSPVDADAHKVIFGNDACLWDYCDIVDWAVSHIGTPYAISDAHQTFLKRPYTYLDCSGLVVAARIQEIGPLQNHDYVLDYINVNSLVQGSYDYNGHHYSTETSCIDSNQVSRGCLVALKRPSGDHWSHVAIIESYAFDRIHHTILNCMIIHAYGLSDKLHRRVRYENFISEFRNQGCPYQFLKFNN